MENLELGCQVKCIKPTGPLIKGRKYNVVEISEDKRFIGVVDDHTGNYISHWILIERFIPFLDEYSPIKDINYLEILKEY